MKTINRVVGSSVVFGVIGSQGLEEGCGEC